MMKGMTSEKVTILRIDSDTIFKAFGIRKEHVTEVAVQKSLATGEFTGLIIHEGVWGE